MSLEGQQIGRYRLLKMLGSGGMGEVYLAEDPPIQRQVAIKVIRAEMTPYPNASAIQEATRLFQREARAIAMLDHPHILPLYDHGETTINGATITYLVMPYRPEGSLVFWLHQRSGSEYSQGMPLHTQDVVHIVRQAAEALQHAHGHQIIHQDVKPANFLIRSNQEDPNRPDLLLADFGIARLNAGSTSTSQSVRGTPTYMAPEQLEGHAVPATDQYALAIMTYELLTGRPPFQGGLTQVMFQHVQAQPAPPSTLNPQLPPEVDAVILHALAKKPEARFRSVSAFAQAFQEAMQSTDAPTIASKRAEPRTDMRATLAISDVEASHGTMRTLTLPGGQRVTVSVPAGAYEGQLIRLGIPAGSGTTGALLITLAITPTAESPAVANTEATVLTPLSSSRGTLSTAQRGLTRGIMLLLTALVLLVIVGSVGFAFFSVITNRQRAPINATSPPSAAQGQTSIPTGATPIPPTAQGQTSIPTHATPIPPTAQGQTSTPTRATPTPPVARDPYTHTGILALNDPLQDNSQGADWLTGTNQNNATCAFIGGAYQSSQPLDGDFHACFARATDFSNFVYEVQMTIVSGYAGGIIFRASQANSTFYYLRISPDGSYDLRAYVDALINHSHLLVSRSSPAIHTGYNQPNLIAVVARGSTIEFYANQQMIVSINDGTFSHGQIGIVSYNQGGLATAVYSNAKVWKL